MRLLRWQAHFFCNRRQRAAPEPVEPPVAPLPVVPAAPLVPPAGLAGAGACVVAEPGLFEAAVLEPVLLLLVMAQTSPPTTTITTMMPVTHIIDESRRGPARLGSAERFGS
jgi:hypothetical protein